MCQTTLISVDMGCFVITVNFHMTLLIRISDQILLGQHLVLVYRNLQLVLSKTIRIGDTQYHI